MADYKIFVEDFIKQLTEMDKRGASSQEVEDFLRKNSRRLVVKSYMDKIIIKRAEQSLQSLSENETVTTEIEHDLYENIKKCAKDFGLSIGEFIVHAVRGYISRRGLLDDY